MNDLKEIARKIVEPYTAWKIHYEPLSDAIAAALQAERDRADKADEFRETLSAKFREKCDLFTEVTARAVEYKTELERVKAERDEAVKVLEPLVNVAIQFTPATPDSIELHYRTKFGYLSTFLTLGHCRAARAVVEKVKPHHSLDIRNPLPYNTPDEQPQAGETEHEAET